MPHYTTEDLVSIAKSLNVKTPNTSKDEFIINSILRNSCINMTEEQLKSLNKQQIDMMATKCAMGYKTRYKDFLLWVKNKPVPKPKSPPRPKNTPKPKSPQKPKIIPRPKSPQKPKIIPRPKSPPRPKNVPKPKSPQKLKIIPRPKSPQKPKIIPRPKSPTRPKIVPRPKLPAANTLMGLPVEIFCKIWHNLGYVSLSYIKGLFALNNQEFTNKIIYCTQTILVDINDKKLLSTFQKIKKIEFSGKGSLLFSYCIQMPTLKEISFRNPDAKHTLIEEKYKRNMGKFLIDFLPFIKNSPDKSEIIEFGGEYRDYSLTKVNDCFYIKADSIIHLDEDSHKTEDGDPTAKYIVTTEFDKKYNLKSMIECISIIHKQGDVNHIDYFSVGPDSYTVHIP